MKAAVLEECNRIIYREIETPVPGDGEVRVQVALTGICGSDVPRALGGRVHSFPLVLGHEFSGRVDAIGKNVDPSLLGARVAGVPLEPCGVCSSCRDGNYSLCSHYGFVGSRSFGSMAEYVIVRDCNVIRLADEVTDIEGAFFEPASVAIHGIELAGVHPGMKAIVLGGGTIGILLAQALFSYGISDVVITNRTEENLAPIRAAGLSNAIATCHAGWQGKAKEMVGCESGGGFDVVFDTAGTPDTIIDAFEVAGVKASVCIVGTPKHKVEFDISQWELLNRKELTVRGSWMSYSNPWPGIEWVKVRDLFANGTLKIVDEMIDEVYPLSRTQEALQRFSVPGGVHGKILIDSRESK